jgi:hypothetical protein
MPGTLPAFDVGLSIDKFDVFRALGITVSCSKFGTSLVGGRDTTVGWHGHEVQGTVEAACPRLLAGMSRFWIIDHLHPILLTSTSKVNSWPTRLKVW